MSSYTVNQVPHDKLPGSVVNNQLAHDAVTPQGASNTKAMDSYSQLSVRDNYVFAALFTTTQIVGLICIIMVAVWMSKYAGGFAWQENPAIEFNFHPLFMIIGMVFLYGNAILIYRVLRSVRKPVLKLMHVVLHSLAFIFTVVALKAVFDSHNLPAKPFANLYSMHSWIGLTTVILFSMQFVAGFSAFLYPGASRLLRIRYLTTHVYFGVLIFVMAIGACLTGMTEKIMFGLADKYDKWEPPALLVNSLSLLLIVFAGLVVYLVSTTKYKRQPLPEEAILPLEPHSPLN